MIRPSEAEGWLEGEPLDGNLNAVLALDRTPDGGSALDQGGTVALLAGRRVDGRNMPTAIRLKGKVPHESRAVQYCAGLLLLRDNVVRLIEVLEPGVHQFFPIDLIWKGETFARWYAINVCNRLDTIDREGSHFRTVGDPPGPIYYVEKKPGESFVFDVARIGGHHIWYELHTSSVFVSKTLRARMRAAKIRGVQLVEYPEIEIAEDC